MLNQRMFAIAPLNFFLVVAFQHKTPDALDGGDRMIRLVCFWFIFLPNKVAELGLALQLTLPYFVMVIHRIIIKRGSWLSGDAVYYMLNDFSRATYTGYFIGQYPIICTFFTHASILAEVTNYSFHSNILRNKTSIFALIFQGDKSHKLSFHFLKI